MFALPKTLDNYNLRQSDSLIVLPIRASAAWGRHVRFEEDNCMNYQTRLLLSWSAAALLAVIVVATAQKTIQHTSQAAGQSIPIQDWPQLGRDAQRSNYSPLQVNPPYCYVQLQSTPTPPSPALTDRSPASTAPPLPATTYQNQIFQEGPTYILEYRDAQARLHYRYTPASGSLHDLEVAVANEPPFLPSHYGGPRFVVSGREIPIWDTEPAQFT
jgi:hypothetical protein